MAPLFFFSREGEIEFNTAIIKQPSEDYFLICLRDDIFSYTIQRMSMGCFLSGCRPLEIHLPRISRFAKAGILHPEAQEIGGGQSRGPRGANCIRGRIFQLILTRVSVLTFFFPERECIGNYTGVNKKPFACQNPS